MFQKKASGDADKILQGDADFQEAERRQAQRRDRLTGGLSSPSEDTRRWVGWALFIVAVGLFVGLVALTIHIVIAAVLLALIVGLVLVFRWMFR